MSRAFLKITNWAVCKCSCYTSLVPAKLYTCKSIMHCIATVVKLLRIYTASYSFVVCFIASMCARNTNLISATFCSIWYKARHNISSRSCSKWPIKIIHKNVAIHCSACEVNYSKLYTQLLGIICYTCIPQFLHPKYKPTLLILRHPHQQTDGSSHYPDNAIGHTLHC